MDAGRGVLQPAEAVEQLDRRQRGFAGAADALAEAHGAAEHADEESREREVGPGRAAGRMDEDEPALAAALAGDERRSVAQARPGLADEIERRFGEDLARYGDVLGNDKAGERAVRGEGSEMRRLLP